MTPQDDPKHSPPTARFWPLALGLCLALLAACSDGTDRTKPEYVNRNEREVSIVHSSWFVPRALAETHCRQFGKSAFYKGAIRIHANQDRKIHYFDCAYPVVD
ncbi:MAG: hypothetical protein ACPGRZ_09930 [Alphaproteobacteria bacterium]